MTSSTLAVRSTTIILMLGLAMSPCLAQTAATPAQAAPAPTAASAPAAKAAPMVLPTVTVTATLAEQEVRTAPATVTVIRADELAASNRSDLLDAVRSAPGLTLSPRQVGGRKTLALRGLAGKHTLTLIDGRRISASDDVVGHSDYQYGWLPMSAVERIEIIRGPMSALYGSEALGGVVNIITRMPADRWQGSVGFSGTDPTTAGEGGRCGRVSVVAAGPGTEALNLRVSAEALHSGTVAGKEDPRVSEIEGRKSAAGGVTGRLRLDTQHTLEAGVNVVDEQRFYDDFSGANEYRNTYELNRERAHLSWQGRT